MKINRLYILCAIGAVALAVCHIVFRIQFIQIPLFLLIIGFAAGIYQREFSLYFFLFLFPFINSSPELFDKGFSFNYMAPALFLLSGIAAAYFFKPLRPGSDRTAASDQSPQDWNFSLYYMFLAILVLSTIFLALRWSNLTLPSLAAVGADTPVSPENPYSVQSLRISFGAIFPVVSLFLYFVSPLIFFMLKTYRLPETNVFRAVSLGFYLSIGLALMQKISGRSLISDRLGKELKQYYGGFSDFNAFGFFAAVMFLWSTYRIRKKDTLGYITLAVSLGGCILSGSRTVFFFILAGIFNLVYHALKDRTQPQRDSQKKIMMGVVLIVLVLVIFAGGTLVKRLGEGFGEQSDKKDGNSLFTRLNAVTNGRLWMTAFTLETISQYPGVGVGTGNFTFYLAYKNYPAYKHKGERYLYDLTLNHYLLIFAENGLTAFLCFTLFLIYLFRRSSKKLLLGTILFSLLFNNFFWFPEAFLLFWVLAALYDQDGLKEPFHKNKKAFLKVGLSFTILLILVQTVNFVGLHPAHWAQQTGFRYDYGFWYTESDKSGGTFTWSTDRAGIHLELDKKGKSRQFRIACGAPLDRLPGGRQKVRLYWKGKLYKELIFNQNKEETVTITSHPGDQGFMELEVQPTFNLKKLHLSEEARDLGIRLY